MYMHVNISKIYAVCECVYIYIINIQYTRIYYVNKNLFWMWLIAISLLTIVKMVIVKIYYNKKYNVFLIAIIFHNICKTFYFWSNKNSLGEQTFEH